VTLKLFPCRPSETWGWRRLMEDARRMGSEGPITLRNCFRSLVSWLRSRSLREWQMYMFEIVLFVFFVKYLLQFAIYHLFG